MEKDFPFFDAFAKHCGVELLDVHEGYARTKMELKKHHLNGLQMPHGAAIFTLADIAFAAAANFRGIPSVAININISFLKQAKGPVLIAEAKEINEDGKVGSYRIEIQDESGEIIAVFDGLAYRKVKK